MICIVTIKFGGDYDELTLVNPKVIETSKEMVIYFEKETHLKKNKIRSKNQIFSLYLTCITCSCHCP